MNCFERGPVTTDELFYTSLRSDVPEISEMVSLFRKGDLKQAEERFLAYLKSTLAKEKFFEVIGFDPSKEPDTVTKKQADEALEYNMVSCDIYHRFDGRVDWYSNHTYNNYEEWTWQLSRHRQVLDLSWVYFHTKEEKYAERAVELLDSWIDQAVAPSPDTDGHTTLCWRTIECGIRMNVWAKCFILLIESPAFEAHFATRFFKSVYEHAERLYNKFTAANWLTIEMNGLYTTALLYPFFIRSDAWRRLAKSTFINQMYEQTLDDGTHYELTFGYQKVALVGFCNALKLGRAFGDDYPEAYTDKLRLQLRALVKVMMPNGDAPMVNDGKLYNVGDSIKSMADLTPEDPLLSFAISRSNLNSPLPAPDFTSVLLENAGFAVFRSDWSKEAIAGFFDGGKFGKCHNHEDVVRCHQHEDKLNFLMYIGEKNILCEAESYAYDASEIRYHVLSSAGHNTALVNGEGQSRLRINHWDDTMLSSSEDVDFGTWDGIEYAKAKYNEGYGASGELSATHERKIYFVKNPAIGLPYFIIKDILSSDSDSEYDLVWHYDTEALEIFGNKAVCRELTSIFAGDEGKTTIYRGSQTPFAGWKSNSFTQGDIRGIPTLYYRVKGMHTEVITAFIPHIDGECPVLSVEYRDGIIGVRYKNGELLKIDF